MRWQCGCQLPPPELLAYDSSYVRTAFICGSVQIHVCLLQPDSPALCCFHFCYNMICLCSARQNLSWQCSDTNCICYTLAFAALRGDIDKRFLQKQTGEQVSVDFTTELAKRIKGNDGRDLPRQRPSVRRAA